MFGRRAVGRDHAAQRTHVADVANQRARVQIPDHGNLVAVQIELRGFRGAPVGSDLRKLAHHQRFDVGPRGFLIVEICAHVSDVRIRQADDLPGIAGIGENFLIAGEAGIENDFAAAARDGAGRAAVKYAPVFEREDGRSVLNFRQWILRTDFIFHARFGRAINEPK